MGKANDKTPITLFAVNNLFIAEIYYVDQKKTCTLLVSVYTVAFPVIRSVIPNRGSESRMRLSASLFAALIDF